MLKKHFAFFGSNGHAKTPKLKPYSDGKPKGKLRKVKHPKTTVNIVDRSTMERDAKADIPTVPSIGKDSMEYYQKQPAGILLNSQETEDRPNDATHIFSPHTQPDETNLISSSISEDPSRDFSEGKEEPRVQTPISVAPTQLWSSIPSFRRDTLGGGEYSTPSHEWDDHGGMKNWGDGPVGGPDHLVKRHRAPGRFITANPHQHDTQEHNDAENGRVASKQQNNRPYRPIVSQTSPPEEDENHARRENVSKHDHRETSKVAILGHGDRIENTFKPEIYYYIVPAGLDIIFQDEDGTQITRVGKTIKGTQDHPSHAHSKNIPIVVQDVLGNELFRSVTLEAIDDPSPSLRLNRDQGSLHDPNPGMLDGFVGRSSPSPNYTSWRAIIVDEKGNQIALKYTERNVGRSTSSSPA